MAFSSNHVYSAIRWALVARISLLILSWSSTIIVMRLLTPGDYGIMAVAAIFTGLASLLSEVGLNEVVIRKQNPDLAFQRAVLGVIFVLNLFLFSMLFACSAIIASSFTMPQLQSAVPVLSLQFIFNALALLPVSLLERKMHYKAMAVVEAVTTITSIAVAIILALHNYGVWALISSAVAGSLARYIAASVLSRSVLLPSWRFQSLKTDRNFALAVFFNKLAWYLASVADDFIIGKLLGKDRLGYYAVSKDLALLFQQKTAAIIHQISFPLLSQQTPAIKRNKLLLKGCSLLSFLVLPLTLITSSNAPLLVEALLGEHWLQVGPFLAVMILVLPIRVLNNLMGNAVSAAGFPQQRLLVQCINLVLVITLTLAGCLLWQLQGAVAGWVMANILLMPLIIKFYLPHLQLRLSNLSSALMANWQASTALLALLLLQHQLSDIHLPAVLMLMCNMTTAAVIYLAASWYFNRQSVLNLRKLLQTSHQANSEL